MASCFRQEATFGWRERRFRGFIPENEHSTNIETFRCIQRHTSIVSKTGHFTSDDRQRLCAFFGREIQNLTDLVLSWSLLDCNGLLADSAAVSNLLAAIPFGGPDMRIVDVSLVNHGEKVLGSFVQECHGGKVCIEFIQKAS